MPKNIQQLLEKAKKGNKQALEEIVLSIKDLIYNLSLRMLLFPEEAKDATQEILIKVISQLDSFRGDSHFTTWVYRIATNYLLTFQAKQSNSFARSFQDYEVLIDSGHSKAVAHTRNEGEINLLEEEVMLSCTHGLLLCLEMKSRLVFIIGEILRFSSQEGALILEMTPENFRQQLSRTRKKIRNFLEKKCGLINPQNPCRCRRKIDYLIEEGIISPHELRFATPNQSSKDWLERIRNLEQSVAIYRSMPSHEFPIAIKKEISQWTLPK